MKAFISYSLNDSEQFILTILSRRLKEYGFTIWSTYNDSENILDFKTFTQINKSNLFIGIITKSGNANNRVFNEWKEAVKMQIPSLLLVEDNVNIKPEILKYNNVLLFNRQNPSDAINKVKQRIEQSQRQQTKPVKKNDNTHAWILGGAAALIILGLLSSDD